MDHDSSAVRNGMETPRRRRRTAALGSLRPMVARAWRFGIVSFLPLVFACAQGSSDEMPLDEYEAGVALVDAAQSSPTSSQNPVDDAASPSQPDSAAPPNNPTQPTDDAATRPADDAAAPPVEDSAAPPPPVDAGSTSTCTAFAPTTTAKCTACKSSGETCQANGCFNGYWCSSSSSCVKQPANCP